MSEWSVLWVTVDGGSWSAWQPSVAATVCSSCSWLVAGRRARTWRPGRRKWARAPCPIVLTIAGGLQSLNSNDVALPPMALTPAANRGAPTSHAPSVSQPSEREERLSLTGEVTGAKAKTETHRGPRFVTSNSGTIKMYIRVVAEAGTSWMDGHVRRIPRRV
eukprot:scaffold191276_cov31-Tisochrysis_lutea.AAC.3